MLTPQEAYSAAILRACEAHLARVKIARDVRVKSTREFYREASC